MRAVDAQETSTPALDDGRTRVRCNRLFTGPVIGTVFGLTVGGISLVDDVVITALLGIVVLVFAGKRLQRTLKVRSVLAETPWTIVTDPPRAISGGAVLFETVRGPISVSAGSTGRGLPKATTLKTCFGTGRDGVVQVGGNGPLILARQPRGEAQAEKWSGHIARTTQKSAAKAAAKRRAL